jgi:hypothetical protein
MRQTIIFLGVCCLAGCQNQNPYAMIGPTTISPPGAQTPVAGYYPPPAVPTIPAGTATASATNASTTVSPVLSVPAKSSAGVGLPAASPATSTIRTDLAPSPPASGTRAGAPAPSFNASDNFSSEQPIRIVEASPAARSGSFAAASQSPSSVPTGIVTATPASRVSSAVPGNAVPFGSPSAPVEISQLPKAGVYAPSTTTSDYNGTRGYIPAQPQTAPAGAQPSRPSSSSRFRSDPNVRSATYLESSPAFREAALPAADGQWKAR